MSTSSQSTSSKKLVMRVNRPIRVGFVTSHPIQYQAPVFRQLAKREGLEFKVLFAQLPSPAIQGAGFGVNFSWDVPLLDGYEYEVLDNVAKDPSVTRFYGCDTPAIGSIIERERFDVVVVNGWVVKSCLQALGHCFRSGVPCMVRGEANDLRPRSFVKRFGQRLLVKRFDAVLPIGEANRRFYLSRGVRSDRMFLSPYCVENQFFLPHRGTTEERKALRERLGLRPDRVVALYCGKFESKKHPLELVEAMRVAIEIGAPLDLLMVGDGELRRDCERMAQKFQLPIIFAGFLNQSAIRDAYACSDFLVLPSDHGETWGLVVNEAFASGLPAIVSDQVGCSLDLIREGETGATFRFGDWGELSKKLVEFSLNPQRVREMGAAARVAIEAYSPRHAADGIAEGAKWVATRRGRYSRGV